MAALISRRAALLASAALVLTPAAFAQDVLALNVGAGGGAPALSGQASQSFYNALPSDGRKYVDGALPSLINAVRAANGNQQEFNRQICKILVINARDAGYNVNDKTYEGFSGSILKNRDFAIGLHLIADSQDEIAVWAASAFFIQKQTAKYSIYGGNSHTNVTESVRDGLKDGISPAYFKQDSWINERIERMLSIIDKDYIASIPEGAARWVNSKAPLSELPQEFRALSRTNISQFELDIRDTIADVISRMRNVKQLALTIRP